MISKNIKMIIKYLLVALVLLLFLAGCTKEYNSDFAKKYSRYLKHSLGEYETNKRVEKSCPGPIPEVKKYFVWDIKYKDVNGKDKIFEINNATDGSKNYKMGFQVYMQAANICSYEIGVNVCNKYFDYIEDVRKVSKENLPVTYCIVDGSYTDQQDDFYSKCINDESGIRLKSISAKELKDKWNGEFEISIITAETKDSEKINEILSKAKSLLKDYSKYLNIDKVTAAINHSEFFKMYKITYDRKLSTFKVENLREKVALEQSQSKERIDNHIRYIDTYIVNNKKLVWLDGAVYDTKTKKYYLDSYIELLRALGIEAQHPDKELGHIEYKWKIGDDFFEACAVFPNKILKNNLEIVTPEAFVSYGGGTASNVISVKDFELISNSTVIIDEEKEVVVIKSK